MNSFKDIAYQILKEVGKPLHSKKITKIALNRGWLKTVGETPEATMNAQLIVDINSKKDKSRFIKTAPSVFGLNPKTAYILRKELRYEIKIPEKIYKISKNVSSKQKGDIAEARIAELITLYGNTALVCYKPVSDVEGIDLIVKERGSLKTMYLQIKSRFGDDPSRIFAYAVKSSTVIDNYAMANIFCVFDTEQGDIWNFLWFVPAPDLIKLATKSDGGRLMRFVAGRTKRESNKWDQYLIDKRDLANAIIAQMKRI